MTTVHTCMQKFHQHSHVMVGLAQAHPNNVIFYTYNYISVTEQELPNFCGWKPEIWHQNQSTMKYTIHTHGQSSALCLVIFSYFLTAQQRGTVRLVRNRLTSTSYSSGRVQVYINSWGYICDFHFATTEADVICHQLGYSGALSHSKSSLDLWVFKYTAVCTLCKLVMC